AAGSAPAGSRGAWLRWGAPSWPSTTPPLLQRDNPLPRSRFSATSPEGRGRFRGADRVRERPRDRRLVRRAGLLPIRFQPHGGPAVVRGGRVPLKTMTF